MNDASVILVSGLMLASLSEFLVSIVLASFWEKGPGKGLSGVLESPETFLHNHYPLHYSMYSNSMYSNCIYWYFCLNKNKHKNKHTALCIPTLVMMLRLYRVNVFASAGGWMQYKCTCSYIYTARSVYMSHRLAWNSLYFSYLKCPNSEGVIWIFVQCFYILLRFICDLVPPDGNRHT